MASVPHWRRWICALKAPVPVIRARRLCLELLEDRWVPATITELPLGTATPSPQGITTGPDGALWYTDPGANKIGRISVTGQVTEYTLPTANSNPDGITTGPDGNLWFTELGTDKIGQINPTTGSIAEFQLSLNTGPADIVAGPDGALWFTESIANQIGRITTAGVVTNEYATTTTGSTPTGITVGSDGRLWFTEYGANQIGAISTSGTISEYTLPGTGNQPLAITANPAAGGSLFFTDYGTNQIGFITTSGTVTQQIATGATGGLPTGIAIGSDGMVYFTDAGTNALGLVAQTGGTVQESTTGITSGSGLSGITEGPNGDLWFTESTNGAIGQAVPNGTTPTVTEFDLRASGGPTGLVTTSTGTVWFTESSADKIGRLSSTGALAEFSLPTVQSNPEGITVGPDGNLWFTEFGTDTIGRITPTGAITEFRVTTGAGPSSIVSGPDGALWFTEEAANAIGRITTAGTLTNEFALPSGSTVPLAITVGPDSRLWFTENGSNQIGAITTAGTITEFSSGATTEPTGIATGPDGALYFGSGAAPAIGRITTAGAATSITGFGSTSTFIQSIVAGADGNLWFTEGGTDAIGRVTTAGAVTELTSGLTTPAGLTGIAVGPDGNLVFGEATANQIGTVALSADLSVTVTSPQTSVLPGETATFTITVSSAAGSDPVLATVSQPVSGLPSILGSPLTPMLTGATWTAVFAGGATGATTGTGSVNTQVTLPAGGTVTYTLTGTVNLGAIGSLTYPASVSSGVTDPNSANNTASLSLPIPSTPPFLVFGAGPGGAPAVEVVDAATGKVLLSFLAFPASFTGGVTVAQGDVMGNGVPDVIVGAGAGGGPVVNVYNEQTGALVESFYAYDPSFRGGVNVAAGDTTGDGMDDIITAPGAGGGPNVRVFHGPNATMTASFFAYASTFTGGVTIATGDIQGTEIADIITGVGSGGGPQVNVFDATGQLLQSFFAFASSFRGGVNVAAGDLTGSGITDIIVGAGIMGGPVASVFNPSSTNLPTASVLAFDSSYRGGVKVATYDTNGIATVEIGPGPGLPPVVNTYTGPSLTPATTFDAFNPGFLGGVEVG